MKMNPESFFVVGLIGGIALALGWNVKPGIAEAASGDIFHDRPLALPSSKLPGLDSVSAALFDSHHQEAVAIFDTLPGFGFSRIAPLIHHRLEALTMEGNSGIFSEHDFTFIGNDPAIRRKSAEIFADDPAVFKVQTGEQSKAVPAEGTDLLALEKFENDPKAERDFHVQAGSIVGYGPLRAKANCANCYGVEEGALLGMFRYRFDIPLDFQDISLADSLKIEM